MSWNYRVVFVNHPQEPYYMMTEVYYNSDGTPAAYATDGARMLGESVQDLTECFERINKALGQPVLTEKDFVGFPDDDEEISVD